MAKPPAEQSARDTQPTNAQHGDYALLHSDVASEDAPAEFIVGDTDELPVIFEETTDPELTLDDVLVWGEPAAPPPVPQSEAFFNVVPPAEEDEPLLAAADFVDISVPLDARPPLPSLDTFAFPPPLSAHGRRRSRQDMSSMLQEFSVMFRVDHRSRRRRNTVIAVSIGLVVVSAASYGGWLILRGAEQGGGVAGLRQDLDLVRSSHAEPVEYLLIDRSRGTPRGIKKRISALAAKLAQVADVRALQHARSHATGTLTRGDAKRADDLPGLRDAEAAHPDSPANDGAIDRPQQSHGKTQ